VKSEIKTVQVEFEIDQSGSFGDLEKGATITVGEDVAKTLETRGIVKIIKPKLKVKNG
jgi:hypothetical protein